VLAVQVTADLEIHKMSSRRKASSCTFAFGTIALIEQPEPFQEALRATEELPGG
jgi:hypothetical protein